MINRQRIIFGSLIIIFLIPVLFFPISPDLSIFLSAGKSVAEGGKVYFDFIDIKPPIIPYLFSFIYTVFGAGEFQIRIFDFIWQLAVAASMIYIIKKLTGESLPAYFAAAIYSISYPAMNFFNTYQCENIIALPLIWLFYFYFKGNRRLYYFLAGFMTGIVVSFKVSFGVIFIAICIYELFNSEYNVLKRFKNLLNLSAGAALAVMITLLPLIDSQSYSGYMDVIKYINYYSSITSFSIGYIKVGIKNFGVFFGYNFSILLIFLAILGSNGMFQRGKSERLLVLSILISLSLIFSIAFERKFFIYHFTRLFLPLTILSGFGLAAAAKTFKTKWYDSPGRTKFVIICLLAAAAAFSPISRWIALLPGPYYYMTNKSKYDKIYHSEYNRILQRIQYIEDAKYLKSRLKSDDKLIVMGIGGNPIYQLSGAKKFSRFAHPSFYFGNFTTPNWQKWIVEDVESADWLVVQDNDNAQIINGHDLSSYESLQQHEKLCSIVNIEFSLDTIILHSRIYKRIKSK